MALAAQDVISAARDYHPAFAEELHPTPLLVRFLSRYQRELVSEILRIDPEVLSATEEIAFPLQNFEAGAPMQNAALHVAGGDVVLTDGATTRLHIVSWDARYEPRGWPAVTLIAGVIYPLGKEADWNHVDKIVLRYVPEPAQLQNPTDPLSVPDAAEETVITRLAVFMALRSSAPVTPKPPEAGVLWDMHKQARAAFLGALADQLGARTSAVREVW